LPVEALESLSGQEKISGRNRYEEATQAQIRLFSYDYTDMHRYGLMFQVYYDVKTPEHGSLYSTIMNNFAVMFGTWEDFQHYSKEERSQMMAYLSRYQQILHQNYYAAVAANLTKDYSPDKLIYDTWSKTSQVFSEWDKSREVLNKKYSSK
jgi:hypothetical protein